MDYERRAWTVPKGVAFLLLAVAIGCIPAVQNRAPDTAILPEDVVALPPQILVYTWDALGNRTLEEEAAEGIGIRAEREVAAVMKAIGGRTASREQLETCGEPCVRFFRWGSTASFEIGLQRAEVRNYGSHSVADWVFPGDVPPIRSALGADFALFVVLKQMRQTKAAMGMMILGGAYTIGKQIDVACVADLRDGKMTWCSTAKDEGGDLDDRERIGIVVRKILNPIIASWRSRPHANGS